MSFGVLWTMLWSFYQSWTDCICLANSGQFQFWTDLVPNLGKQFDLVNDIFGLYDLHKSCNPMPNISNGINFKSFGPVYNEIWPNE